MGCSPRSPQTPPSAGSPRRLGSSSRWPSLGLDAGSRPSKLGWRFSGRGAPGLKTTNPALDLGGKQPGEEVCVQPHDRYCVCAVCRALPGAVG